MRVNRIGARTVLFLMTFGVLVSSVGRAAPTNVLIFPLSSGASRVAQKLESGSRLHWTSCMPGKRNACFEDSEADLVLALGDGDCEISIESALATSQGRVGYRFPAHALTCGSTQAHVSVSAPRKKGPLSGTLLSLRRRAEKEGLPFIFLKVTSSSCKAPEAPEVVARTLGSMLSAVADYMGQHPEYTTLAVGYSGTPMSLPELPTTLGQAREMVTALRNANAPRCQIDFAEALEKSYR